MPSKSSKAFRLWRKRMEYSTKDAAMSLDLCAAAVKYYCAGRRRENAEEDYRNVEVPLVVLLACAAVEAGIDPIC